MTGSEAKSHATTSQKGFVEMLGNGINLNDVKELKSKLLKGTEISMAILGRLRRVHRDCFFLQGMFSGWQHVQPFSNLTCCGGGEAPRHCVTWPGARCVANSVFVQSAFRLPFYSVSHIACKVDACT